MTEEARVHLFDDGFRPFFLGAAAVAALHVVAWLYFLLGHGGGPAALSPIVWHGHELVFGFAGALIAGFLLTAVPNWAGRPVAGRAMLVALFVLWLLPRFTIAVPQIPWPLTQVLAAAFLPALTVVVALPIIAARNARNYQVIVILAALSVAGIALHLDPSPVMLRAAMDVLLLLLVIVGARVIPFFTGRRLPDAAVRPDGAVGHGVTALVAIAVIGPWLSAGQAWPWLQAIAGAALLTRMARWKPWRTLGEPMLWILHLGYLWLAIALMLRAAPVPPTVALHALTMGGLGCLAVGMMARVALGHSGRPIRADGWIITSFVLVAIAVVPRLAYPLLPFDAGRISLVAAAALWTVGFLVYFGRFLPVMLTPRR